MKKNKNKKFLFLSKKGRNKKEAKDLFNTVVASILIITITSSFFSFLDYKISLDSNKNEDLKMSNLPSTEEIINKILAINEVGAASINYKASSYIPSSKMSLDGNVGEVITFTLQFKNVGNYVWRQAGTNQMVLRVKDNKTGLLKSDKWISNSIVANLKQSIVRVGETGEFEVKIKVPNTKSSDTYVMYVKSYNQEVVGSSTEIIITPKNVVNSSSVVNNTVVENNKNNSIIVSSSNILTKSYKLWDDNSEIKKLQQFLNNNGYIIATSGVGSKGRETNTFGPATQKALSAFQKKYNLSNAGTLTVETINFINSFGKDNSNSTISAQSSKDKELVLENISYISSDKKFDIIDSVTSNVVLTVNSGEKINIFFNQITKTYSVSKNGLIHFNSKNKLNIKNTGSGNIDFGGTKYTNTVLALKSDFDIPVNNSSTSTGNGKVVCASVDCNLVDNNTNPNVVSNETSNIINTGNVTTSTGAVIEYLNHAYIKDNFKIRVGLSADLMPATITNNLSYNIVDGNNNLVLQVNPGEQIVFNYDKSSGMYSVNKNGVNIISTSNYIKLQNVNNGVFTIVNMTFAPYGVNYNKFIGDLEVRYNSTYNKTWIINELYMEDYLKGMGEASNSSSYEYLKVMAVLERTYATYHFLTGTKNAAQYFDVFSTTADQAYYGYARQLAQPNVVKAVDETKGIYVTYDNKIIQAFYSANAGGKTRTLSETWGGSDLPYLKPVVDKYTTNDTRFGHGVGLSQVGAIRMIAYDNADFTKVLTYYYTGIKINKLY